MITYNTLNSVEPVEEIVWDDSVPENTKTKDNEIKILMQKPAYKIKCRSLLKKNILLRGLLPHERHKSYCKILSLPVVKRCCIEHSYFIRTRSRNSRYNFRSLPAKETNTLLFENNKSVEQPTIDVECLAPELISEFLNNSFNKNNVKHRKNRTSFNGNSCDNVSGKDFSVDDSNDQNYFSVRNSTESDSDTASVDSFDSLNEINKKNTSNILQNGFDKDGKTDGLALSNPDASEIQNKFIDPENYFEQIEDMQKLLKAKFVSEKSKTGKIPLPRLKKMMGQRKDENILEMSEYLFPLPNLTKIPHEDKNWRVEYMNDEVQNLGLDDLLLKASELNAENFTKALGRKQEPMKANFNSKDSSEIIFTIPKAKKNSEDSCENGGDFDKKTNLKTIKLDISKPFFDSEKPKEAESVKPIEDASPKRSGIKVKTVENINEEFRDSLGRLNGLDKEISSGLDKTNFGVSIKESEEEKKPQDKLEKDAEGSRPFIMTIIQSKSKKQRPAILRNSYLKKKANTEKVLPRESIMESAIECRVEGELSPAGNLTEGEKTEDDAQILEKSMNFTKNLWGEKYVIYPKIFESKSDKVQDEEKFPVKKRNIPFILNHNRKVLQTDAVKKTPSKLVKINEGSGKLQSTEKTFKITSIEQKLGPKEINRRFIKVVPYEPISKAKHPTKTAELQQKLSDDDSESPQKDGKSSHILSLTAFSAILKEILPDKWFLCLDKKHGLQIIKTHLDEFLNPSILISVVIARCGKLTVNVRGKQLHKSHELFTNLCDISNSENKLSLNYVLAILNKLRHRSVCFGCDDPSLKKYWSNDGIIENQTEFQQVYRSQICQLLVSLGKRRCHPCYRMNESLKKRYRRDKLREKAKEDKDVSEEQKLEQTPKTHLQQRGVKRNLEDLLEESFSTMKQQIVSEIEKNKKLGERENALKAQEEVLSFMGLTRKESLDNPVRKSKRKKNSFYKLQQPVKKKTDQKELEFLEKYWNDINTLFSTSLLFGAYSRTGRGRLREKCRMFRKLLTTWKDIVTCNPEWIGEISFPDEVTEEDNPLGKDSNADQFEKMDVPALRAYIINSVKEVNRIKHKLRTRNSYFKVLYNKFVKRRIKRPKTLGSHSQKKGNGSSATSTTNTPTPTDFSSDENSRDREKNTAAENEQSRDGVMKCISDAD